MFLKFIFLLSILSFLHTEIASAFPLPKRPMNGQILSQIKPSGNLRAANFRAIVALDNCSGSLVRFENSVDTDFAMILTNGHCYEERGFLKPGEVKVGVPAERTFALLNNDGSRYAGLTADRVIVATMTKTDITLYRLNQTYGQIFKKYQVQALTLSSKHPEAKTSIAVVSGYWKKVYTCQIDDFVYALKEADWTMLDSIRYSSPGCEIIGGTSGSPIINLATYQVIGVNNTSNESGRQCTMNNPCEVDANGKVTVRPHASYGQETYVLYSCLNSERQIDLKLPNCALRP